MKDLAQYLAHKDLTEKIAITEVNLDVTEEGLNLTYTFNDKKYKKKIKQLNSNRTLQELQDSHIATEMLNDGYSLLSLEGGWLVVNSNGDYYELGLEECTCPAFIHKTPTQRCKHLIFRDWHLNYKKQLNALKKRFQA